ncbi:MULTISPECIES: acyltransferase domain-containing protein [Streptomyces]|uniref:acyltransferase domain-containing protein n=1 Tax=Streptomyces TaxID=1883 RepID=UPI00163CBA1E|nr:MULTISPECIES: acyltransferase domain-containing protein [Streptomyces]MBC2878379.1 acyltransferase domain-containing protein [Streptomyces sp. TYQ1024]UBI40505.1 acyltransferase domain-containing protein [Streptomyces mobaraensis]UKW33087.1 acyltransferase domain-containing protein [Streptomyces sp. TYQ1024]
MTAPDVPGLVEGLSCFADGLPSPRWTAGRADGAAGRTAWCFGGHGSQWTGMGRALPAWSPVAAGVLAELDGLLPGGVTGPLARPPGAGADGPGTAQPLIFALQVATAHWLLSLGLRPDAVVGHSLGEVAAAHIAGVLTLPEAARVVATRSRLLARVAGGGAMATIGLDRHTVERHCARTPGTVVVAAHSAPRETVVTGAADAVGALVGALEAAGVRCRTIRIDAASHSPYVDGVLPELRAELAGLAPAAPRVPWVSTVDAARDPAAGAGPRSAAGAGPRPSADTAPDTTTATGAERSGADPEPSGSGPAPSTLGTPDYWARNLRQPVRFTQAVSALAGRGVRAFVEIGPHPVLARPIRDTLRDEGVAAPLVAASGHRGTPEPVALLRLLGALYCRGLDLSGLPNRPGLPDLPKLPGRPSRPAPHPPVPSNERQP